MKKIAKTLPLMLSLGMIGCAATKITETAQQVMVVNSEQKIPAGCKYLGQVTGKQGNFFTGGYTSNANLATGAMNNMRNKAAEMGGNYVQLLTNQASSSGGGSVLGSGVGETEVVNLGNVYNCPESSLSS